MNSDTNEDWSSVGPYPVTVVRYMVHHLKDGTRIAMSLYLPWTIEQDKGFLNQQTKDKWCKLVWKGRDISENEKENKFPVILEFLPYGRETKVTLSRDFKRHPWYTSHGFVCVRADQRGTGDSGGTYLDEYVPQEQEDCIEIMQWLCKQHWCNGNVGIYGKSWGGFNGLQVSYYQPKELKAIVSLFSTDDRYSDDIHYMGGCLIGNGMLNWSANMFIYNVRPLHPIHWPDKSVWRQEYLSRIEHQSAPWDKIWVEHQTRNDPYWAHGSINEDFSKIESACWCIGGYPDGYTNPTFRMAGKLNKRSKGTVGQWAHQWPDAATPGPQIDFLNMVKDWFSYHMKSPEAAREEVLKWPDLRMYIQDSTVPDSFLKHAPGQFVDFPKWREYYAAFEKFCENPSSNGLVGEVEPGTLTRWWFKGENELSRSPIMTNTETRVNLVPHPAQGENAGEWYSACMADMPDDQKLPNSHSQCWISPVLDKDFVVAGFPCVFLQLEAEEEGIYGVAVRLCDQRPDGTSYRITYGLKNVCQWKGQMRPEKSFPAKQKILVPVLLNGVGYRVPKGHRLLISVTPSYFPTMFPLPNTRGLTLHPDESFVVFQSLPTERVTAEGYLLPKPVHNPFNLPQITHTPDDIEYEPWTQIEQDGKKIWQKRVINQLGDVTYPTVGMRHTDRSTDVFLTNDDVTWGKTIINRQLTKAYPDQDIAVTMVAHSSMEGTPSEIILNNRIRVSINGEKFYEKEFPETRVHRDYV